ncbi:MAG: hypothetical protein DHS20C19_30840 [Acidimicrobiales bacterium]|nr:MAG: hypothetical protein DHS20C19_30840 [Acidimicrobiales bacterium]
MLNALHVMGEYWEPDADEPTALGALVGAVRNAESVSALRELERLLSGFVLGLDLPVGPLVAAVPPGPDRVAHPVPSLAACVAEALDVDSVRAVLTRSFATPQLRDTPVGRRRDVVEAAGYAVNATVRGRSVVLVDDVVLTGTTLDYLAEILLDAGAAEVVGIVAARTRLRDG